MSKVFSYFQKNVFVNSKIIIPIIIGIVIVIVGAITINNQESDTIEMEDVLGKELNEENAAEVEIKLNEIKDAALENEYSPKPREWITSGPFKIDRSEYVLGEKIFMITEGLGYDEKGEAAFLRPLNNTHYSVYLTIPFDGSNQAAFNYYLDPKLSKINGYCTADAFVGDWRVVFRGTDYPNLEFKITDEILPGEEKSYEPVC